MSSPQRAAQSKARRTLLAIAAVFALPLVLAWLFTIGPSDWRPAQTVNHGVLLEPPLQLRSYGVTDAAGAALAADVPGGHWFLVVLHESACAAACQHWVQIAERIQIAVGRDMDRVTVVVLGPDDDVSPAREPSWLLPANGALIDALREVTDQPRLDAALLVVDYRGHVVLTYPPAENGPGVLKDLKRLLRASPRA